MHKLTFVLFALLSLFNRPILSETESRTKSYTYQAYYESPCGRSVLVLKVNNKQVTVNVTGKDPTSELSAHVLSNTPLLVTGYFLDKKSPNGTNCEGLSVFFVTEYHANSPVSRCTTAGDWAVNETVLVFKKDLPKDKLIDIDYNQHANSITRIETENCRQVDSGNFCLGNELVANSCDGQEHWCCRDITVKGK